jgi:hypothetical protein
LSEAVAKGGNTTLSEVEMTERKGGNLLMVANYPSCTGYAWWLMEHFWKLLAQRAEAVGSLAYLAYPKITKLSKSIQNSPIVPVELSIPWHSIREAAQVTAFLKKKNINYLYLTDQRYFNLQYPVMRACGVNHIIVHDHSPGDRPPVGGLKGAVKVLRNNLPTSVPIMSSASPTSFADAIYKMPKYLRKKGSSYRTAFHQSILMRR